MECPSCGKFTEASTFIFAKKMIECSCGLSADKNAEIYTCPLCDTQIDVQQQIKKEAIKNKGLASVIKYEGANDIFVWKHPIEDFNMGSQLIVHGK